MIQLKRGFGESMLRGLVRYSQRRFLIPTAAEHTPARKTAPSITKYFEHLILNFVSILLTITALGWRKNIPDDNFSKSTHEAHPQLTHASFCFAILVAAAPARPSPNIVSVSSPKQGMLGIHGFCCGVLDAM
jgi:hypothetical protein